LARTIDPLIMSEMCFLNQAKGLGYSGRTNAITKSGFSTLCSTTSILYIKCLLRYNKGSKI
jgi:hypothetical protein